MSGSRPPSPSPNSPPTNIAPSPESTTSRTYIYSNIPIEHQQQQQQTVAPTPTTSQSYASHQVPQSGVKRPPSPDRQEESSTMAKRLRRVSPMLKHEDLQERMSPSSESQDTETYPDTTKGKRPEPHSSESAPVKKKRTRTLTTPHQAAVLHALLAQSRFPTTAMREEVGRSIGLSARKIWFQNQRQKARRPRKEPDESAPLPPRYGPFPAYPPQAHSSSFPMMSGPSPPPNPQLLPITYNAPVQQPYGRSQHPSEPSSSGQFTEPQGRLLGPGVPGADLHGPSHRDESRGQRDTAPSQEANTPSGTPYSSGSSSHLYSPRISLQPPIPVPRLAPPISAYDHNFNRTLPPLSFDSARPSAGGTSVPGGSRPHSPLITLPPPEPSRPRPRSSVSPQVPHFVPHATDLHGHSRVVLPPPFTLQPEPHWDELAFSASLRPGAFARPPTRSQTTRSSSSSPITHLRESSIVRQDPLNVAEPLPVPGPSTPALTPESTFAPPIRGGRYDPVRATFIPYSATGSSPTPSPRSQRNLADDADDA
ncbi:hypothetical protein P691DRAFT_759703 [Macrolepiota fuliginosa MF-IS2]|uniref:Homeobox domain-containing protein n=1 Tax=Macrolepiota fuliginosa MF-IS2 TaxID=1400762 RepID=A0A9P6C4S4_9AGAR|nr:hypothetical protein P691DRAFT_759703 [Macrolepiota fuliginosa MF-IS2]